MDEVGLSTEQHPKNEVNAARIKGAPSDGRPGPFPSLFAWGNCARGL